MTLANLYFNNFLLVLTYDFTRYKQESKSSKYTGLPETVYKQSRDLKCEIFTIVKCRVLI